MDASGIQHAIDDIAKEFPIPAGERARSRAEAADWAKYSDQIDHEEVRQLDAYGDLPGDLIERFDKLLADDAKLRAMWEHGEKEEGGRTGSDYVYALGMSLHWHGFDIEDFARLAMDMAVHARQQREGRQCEPPRHWPHLGEGRGDAEGAHGDRRSAARTGGRSGGERERRITADGATPATPISVQPQRHDWRNTDHGLATALTNRTRFLRSPIAISLEAATR